MDLFKQGYTLARVAIVIDDKEGYTVIGTLRADDVPDEVLVADRLTWDEMLGCVARATSPGQGMPFAKRMPPIVARALKETERT